LGENVISALAPKSCIKTEKTKREGSEENEKTLKNVALLGLLGGRLEDCENRKRG